MNPIAKRVVTGVTVGALVIAALLLVPVQAFLPVCAVLAALAAVEFVALYRKGLSARSRSFGFGNALLCAFGALVVAGAVMTLAWIALHFDDGHLRGNLMLFYLLAIVKFSDVGGFAFGLTSARLMKGGNHKMCPTISPNKSWEGLLGSVVFSCVVSCAFIPFTGFGLVKALAFGAAAALVGTAGDLVESKFKRWVGVKDSSTMKLTNGMGGILDMLDSVLFAPVILALFV